MKGDNLGEFEELILLVVLALKDEAYAVRIQEELKQKAFRSAAIGAVHTALYRLEDKGFLKSHTGGATTERGGRWKRFFTVTAYAKRTLEQSQEIRLSLWSQIPELSISNR
jgi:PadR family transcriptional regulator, regulatory protein PadR